MHDCIDNSTYTFSKNKLQNMYQKRKEFPLEFSPMILDSTDSKRILEEATSSFEKIESDESPRISSKLNSSRSNHKPNSPTFDKKIHKNPKNLSLFIDNPHIPTKDNKETDIIINQSSHMFGEEENFEENDIIDDEDDGSELSYIDLNFENSKMCRQLIKTLYNTSQYNSNINKIIEDFNIDVELIREKSPAIKTNQDNHAPQVSKMNPLFDFDNDVQIPEEFDKFTNLICFLSIPRIVYLNGDLNVFFISPCGKNNNNEFMIICNKAETGLPVLRIKIKELTQCSRKTTKGFVLQYIHSKSYTKVNIDIITREEEECEKCVEGITLLIKNRNWFNALSL